MKPAPIIDETTQKVSERPAHGVPLGRHQRAIVGQWQALGYLIAFLGVMTGTFMANGTPILGGFYLLLSLALLEPLALSAASARAGRYRLASLFGALSALTYAVLAVIMVTLPLDATSLLALLARGLEAAVAAGLLVGAASTTFGATRALWGASDEPGRLGPGQAGRGPRALSAGDRLHVEPKRTPVPSRHASRMAPVPC